MGKVIVIKNSKGGVGKSFLTSQIASGLTLFDMKVLILTSDSQNNIIDNYFDTKIPGYKGGLKSWVTKGEGDIIKLRQVNEEEDKSLLHFIALEDNKFGTTFYEKFPTFIKELKKQYDFILVDSVPTLKIDEMFVKIADQYIIPTVADKTTTRMLLNYLHEIDTKKINSIVINKYKNNELQNEWVNFLKSNLPSGIKVHTIKDSLEVAKLLNKGYTIFQSGSKTLSEIQDEVLKIVNSLRKGVN